MSSQDSFIKGAVAPGLEALAVESRERVMSRARLVEIPQGWTPVHEKTPGDKVYLVVDGAFEVRKDGVVRARLGPGDFAGEMAPVLRSLRSATLVAHERVQAIAWPRQDFDELRTDLPDFDAMVTRVALEHRRVD